jgi:DNA-binding NarL/FixJ family response regulator
MLEMLNFTDRAAVIGKTDHDLPWKDIAKALKKHDKLAMEKGIYSMEETYTDANNQKKIYLTKKSRLSDQQNNIIGVMGTSIDITAEKEAEKLKLLDVKNKSQLEAMEIYKDCTNSVLNMMQNIQIKFLNDQVGNRIKVNPQDKKITLTPREKQILYLLSFNRSSKEIASFLSSVENKPLSPLTVASMINKKLYKKLDVTNTRQLIEKANHLKLIPFILDSFISN